MSTEPFGPGCPWYSMYESWGPANVKWCEQTLCSIVNEPANAWSNFAFIIAGLFYWNKFRTKNQDVAWLAMSGVIMGVFSFIYHATNNALTQYFDFFGMYVFLFFIITLNYARLKGLPGKAFRVPYWSAVLAMSFATPIFRKIGFPIQLLILVGVLVVFATERACISKGKAKSHLKHFIGMGVFFGIAISFSMLDVTRILCMPDNHFIQGHALWHIFSSLGMIAAIHHYQLPQVKK